MEKVYGSCGRLNEMQVSGMTDTQIMFEALRGEGFTPERIFAEKERLLETFREEMARFIAQNQDAHLVLAGVREILDATDKNPLFVNALLTGNLSCAAEIKLKLVGLWHYFDDKPNAFGEISHDRRELAKQAGKLFNEFYDFDFQPAQFVVVGDTPNDIVAARAFGAKVVAVTTGKNHSKEELTEHEPDVLLDDLKDTKRVLEIFESL